MGLAVWILPGCEGEHGGSVVKQEEDDVPAAGTYQIHQKRRVVEFARDYQQKRRVQSVLLPRTGLVHLLHADGAETHRYPGRVIHHILITHYNINCGLISYFKI